jgi:hypothetical protein
VTEDQTPPRPLGERLWGVERRLRVFGVQAGRRMGIAKLAGGELFVHSPAPLTDELRGALDALGPVRFVVPASNLHGHLFMEQYAAAYPEAELFAAPGLRRRREDLDFAADLGDSPDPRWQADIDQVLFRGHRLLHEVLFLHRPSRTLIVGDFCWNVTPRMAWTGRLWGGWKQGVRPTRAFRLGIRDRDAARASLERVLSWDFEQILIGHGEMVESGGRAAVRRAYAWLLR